MPDCFRTFARKSVENNPVNKTLVTYICTHICRYMSQRFTILFFLCQNRKRVTSIGHDVDRIVRFTLLFQFGFR